MNETKLRYGLRMVMLYFMATQTLHTSRYLFLETKKGKASRKIFVFLGNSIRNDPVRVGEWENDGLVILRDAGRQP